MDTRIIKTEAEHHAALAEIARLMEREALSDAERGSLEVLALLSEAYEEEHHPIGLPDPIEAIRLRMLDLGLATADLADVMGGGERAAEVLERRSPLTVPMVRGLASRLGLPLDVLVQDYEVASRAA